LAQYFLTASQISKEKQCVVYLAAIWLKVCVPSSATRLGEIWAHLFLKNIILL
jgi:hypothetical protein